MFVNWWYSVVKTASYNMPGISPIGLRCANLLIKGRCKCPTAMYYHITCNAILFCVCVSPNSASTQWNKRNPVQALECTDKISVQINSTCLLGEFTKFRKETINFVMSVCLSAWDNSVLIGRIFNKFHIRVFFENPSKTHTLCSTTDDNIKRPKRFACWLTTATNSGFGGLEVAWWPSSRVQTRPKPSDFSGRKKARLPSEGK